MANNATRLLTEASLLPAEMPENYISDKMRGILKELEACEAADLRGAIEAAQRLKIRGPLAVVIFIKHHLAGAHEVEVDRVEEHDAGYDYAALIYPEGEISIRVVNFSRNISSGSRLHYDPAQGQYS